MTKFITAANIIFSPFKNNDITCYGPAWLPPMKDGHVSLFGRVTTD